MIPIYIYKSRCRRYQPRPVAHALLDAADVETLEQLTDPLELSYSRYGDVMVHRKYLDLLDGQSRRRRVQLLLYFFGQCDRSTNQSSRKPIGAFLDGNRLNFSRQNLFLLSFPSARI